MRSQIDIRIAQQRQNRMVERRGRQLDLAAADRFAILGHHGAQDLHLHAAEDGLVLLGEAVPLRDERANAFVALEVQRVNPYQLVPHLQVADVVDRELRGERARAQSLAVAAPACEQFRIPRKRVDHPRFVGVEEVLDAEGTLVLRQRIRRLQPELQVSIVRFIAGKGFELHEQRRHQVERDPHLRKLAHQRDHAPVVLDAMQPHPREDVLARDQVLVEGLMHVPEDCNAGHNADTGRDEDL